MLAGVGRGEGGVAGLDATLTLARCFSGHLIHLFKGKGLFGRYSFRFWFLFFYRFGDEFVYL